MLTISIETGIEFDLETRQTALNKILEIFEKQDQVAFVPTLTTLVDKMEPHKKELIMMAETS